MKQLFKIEIFGKIKDYAFDYTKSAASILTGIILFALSAMFQFHSITQFEILFSDMVWQTPYFLLKHPEVLTQPYASVGGFVDGPIYQGTVGGAYDFFLGMNFFGWVLALLSVFFIMLGALIYFRTNYLEFKDALNASHSDVRPA